MSRYHRLLPIVLAAGLLSISSSAIAGSFCGNPFPPCDPGDPNSWCYVPPPNLPPKCTKCSCTRSPCYVGSGLYSRQEVDLELSTAGFPLRVSRQYVSAHVIDGPIGYGWISSLSPRLYYTVYLLAAPSTFLKEADIVMPDGNLYSFIDNGNGTFTPPQGRYDTLVQNGDGSFDLTPQRTRARLHFAPSGALSSMADEFGNTVAYTYDANGRIQQVSDTVGSGRYLNVYWGADGRISSVQDSSGRSIQYHYNTSGQLVSVVDPLGRTTTLGWTNGKFGPLMTSVADNWSRNITTIAYDTRDRATSYVENGETFTYVYAYQNDGTKASKSDSAGNTWVYSVVQGSLVSADVAPGGASVGQTSYFPDGSVQLAVDAVGVSTGYTYNASGSVTSVTRDQGGATAVRYDYTYDPAFPEKVESVAPKNPSTNAFDPNWQGWVYDYYATGSIAPGALHHVNRVENDGTTADVVATYEYDASGRVTRQTTAGGASTDYLYNSLGNLQSVTGPANNDAGTRPTASYTYDSAGRVLTATDANGKATTYTYDLLGRVLTVTLPKPTPGSPLDFTTTYSYDHFDSASSLLFTWITDPNGKMTKLGYDQYGRLLKSIDAANNATIYGYTRDTLTSITDANNNVTSYAYDARKRLVTTTFPDGASESYTYTSDGLLHTKTDRRAQTITYGYDAHKRVTSKTYSTGGAIAYTYVGQKLTQVDDTTVSPTESHTYDYDSSYRLSTNGQGGRGTLSYTYTADDRVGTLSIQYGPSGTYGYYPDGSLRTIDWSPVPNPFQYTYSLTGQYQQISFPNGQTRSYSYDDQGRLLQLTNALGGTTLAAVGYGHDTDPFTGLPTLLGQRTSQGLTLPHQGLAAAQTTFGYDALYQLTRAQYPLPAPFNGENDQWSYDAIGNRLTSTVNGTTATYGYFKNGANPLNGQRLQTDSANVYAYDANGSNSTRTGGQSFAFGYDAENRLTGITGGAAATYEYDFQGRRKTKTVGGITTTYLYDGQNLVGETSGGTAAHYAFGAGIDEPLAMSTPAGVSFFDMDGLGSTLATNDAAGNVTMSTVFDAWGNARSEVGTRTHPFTYTGREVGEAGLLFYRARYYQPSIGRFTQEDPISSPGGFAQIVLTARTVNPPPMDPQATSGGLNLGALIRNTPAYGYATSNPVNFTDPSGLYCCKQSFGDCFVECLKAGDPLNNWHAPIVPIMPMPKWPFFPHLWGSSPFTTPVRALGHASGSSAAASAGKAVGRALSPVAVGYGAAMAGIELFCAIACGSDPCMFMP